LIQDSPPNKSRALPVDLRIGLLALVVAHQQSAGAAGQIGDVGAALIEDQIQVPAEGIC
jgi:hypothetical protein